MKSLPKMLVILGPTATGKSDLAVRLAKRFHGEIVSADSRQVYRGMDLGTGKVTKKEMGVVPHHLLDAVSPKTTFSVTRYQKLADQAITDILGRGKLPIICGGTGFYIEQVVKGITLPEVNADPELRAKLEKHSAEKLLTILSKLDSKRAGEMDPHNKVRLVRAIEIAKALGHVPKPKENIKYHALQIGLTLPPEILKKRIHDRLLARLKKGMVREVASLHTKGVSWKRLEALGLEYRYVARYIRGLISREQMVTELEVAIWHYAKRQMTWFRRDKEIQWYSPTQLKTIEKIVTTFVRSRK